MSEKDEKKLDGSIGQPFPRRKLVYAAPMLMSRRMFYSQSQCNKAGGQGEECKALPGNS
jgi:hypothetical protein